MLTAARRAGPRSRARLDRTSSACPRTTGRRRARPRRRAGARTSSEPSEEGPRTLQRARRGHSRPAQAPQRTTRFKTRFKPALTDDSSETPRVSTPGLWTPRPICTRQKTLHTNEVRIIMRAVLTTGVGFAAPPRRSRAFTHAGPVTQRHPLQPHPVPRGGGATRGRRRCFGRSSADPRAGTPDTSSGCTDTLRVGVLNDAHDRGRACPTDADPSADLTLRWRAGEERDDPATARRARRPPAPVVRAPPPNSASRSTAALGPRHLGSDRPAGGPAAEGAAAAVGAACVAGRGRGVPDQRAGREVLLRRFLVAAGDAAS